MNIRIPEELDILSEIFRKNKEKLYLVGGYIRNQLIGVPDKNNIDIDVCSSAKPEKVIEMLKNTEFEARYMNEELGVIQIKRNLRIEYATFRKEKYAFSGVHLPNNIEFIKDINEDALRRDFRCNAIYYDISEQEIVDPLNGLKDIEKKIIRTTKNPHETFSDDAERILRMVRFASTLGFNIDEDTYLEAKNNAYKLKFLSSTRKREEFSKIVLADTKYPFLSETKMAHARGIMLLADLGALGYILPALETIRLSNIIENKGKLLFNHVINVFAYSKPQVRLSALLHDVGKAKTFLEYNSFNGSEEFDSILIEKNLGQEGLCYSKKIVERVKNVVKYKDFNKYGLENAKNIRRFIYNNLEIVDLVIYLKDAIAYDKTNKKRKSYSGIKISRIYNQLKNNEAPLNIRDLDIKGDKIIENIPNIKTNKISLLLELLLYKCLDKPYYNKEATLIILAKKIAYKNKKEFLEM